MWGFRYNFTVTATKTGVWLIGFVHCAKVQRKMKYATYCAVLCCLCLSLSVCHGPNSHCKREGLWTWGVEGGGERHWEKRGKGEEIERKRERERETERDSQRSQHLTRFSLRLFVCSVAGCTALQTIFHGALSVMEFRTGVAAFCGLDV